MGRIYDTVRNIDAVIARKGLPVFKTKGLIAIKAGFSLALIDENTPENAPQIAALRAAAREVLGEIVV